MNLSNDLISLDSMRDYFGRNISAYSIYIYTNNFIFNITFII